MKGLVALLALAAMAITVLAALMITLIELVVRLAPLLLIGAIAIAVMIVCQTRQRRRMPDIGPVDARRPPTGRVVPGGTPPPAPVGLPPMMQHRQRVYLIAGQQTGLESLRPDGYVKASAPQLPPARPIASYRLHRGGRAVRTPHRPRRTKTRP